MSRRRASHSSRLVGRSAALRPALIVPVRDRSSHSRKPDEEYTARKSKQFMRDPRITTDLAGSPTRVQATVPTPLKGLRSHIIGAWGILDKSDDMNALPREIDREGRADAREILVRSASPRKGAT